MRLRPLTEAECYARCYGGRTAKPPNQARFVSLEGRAESAEPRWHRSYRAPLPGGAGHDLEAE